MPIKSTAENLQKIVQGRITDSDSIIQGVHSSVFVKMIVLEVISDPHNDNLDDQKRAKWESLGVSNIHLSTSLPRNSIVAQRAGSSTPPMFLFPFFPSHLSLPCKAGESVWVLFENSSTSRSNIGYWFCRVVEVFTSDDVNHTHPGRALDTTSILSAKDRHDLDKSGTDPGEQVWYELRNGPTLKNGDEKVTAVTSVILPNKPEDIFESILLDTDAGRITSYESIPRYRKRPGDIVLEGSNNSLIVLGNDRQSSLAQYEATTTDEEKKNGRNFPVFPESDIKHFSGNIDLVVGRGQSESTHGKDAETKSITKTMTTKGAVIKKEINKSKDYLSNSEGDPDFLNDRSRILVSQRTYTDAKFAISGYANDFSIKDADEGDASVVIKTDKVRTIGRSDVVLMSTGYTTSKSEDSIDIKTENIDSTKWSSLTLNDKGDILASMGKDRVLRVGPNKEATDPSKALLSLDAGSKQVIMPLADGGTALIGGASILSSLGVFDNSSNAVTIGGGGPGALIIADVANKLITLGTTLLAIDVNSGAISIGGGAVLVAGPPGGSGPVASPAPASEVSHHAQLKTALQGLVTAITAIDAFLTAAPAPIGAAYAPIKATVQGGLTAYQTNIDAAATNTKMI